MVSGAEELVSRVVRVKGRQGADLHLPVGVVVPFCARYHGCYRDVAVKMLDEEGRTSYITPRTTEGAIGGHRVRVGNKNHCLGKVLALIAFYTVSTTSYIVSCQ